MGAVDDFNAIRALTLQFEMQKAGSMCGTGSFFRVVFDFSVRSIFPAMLSKHCFLLSNCWSYVFFCYRKVSLVLLSYRYLKSLKVESRQISIIIFYNIEKIVKNMQKIFTKIHTRAFGAGNRHCTAVFEPKAERKAAVYRRGSGCYFRLSVSGRRHEVAYFFI